MATRGDTVHLDCLPEAWPEPQIQWRHNGQLIDLNDSNNRLLTSLADGSAKYAIQRIASAGFNGPAGGGQQSSSSSSPLLLSERPNGAPEAKEQGGINGAEMLMMQTGADQQQPPAGNNNERSPQAASQTEGPVDFFGSRLVIRQVDKMDEGKYTCLVETKGSHRIIERESPAGQLTVSGK